MELLSTFLLIVITGFFEGSETAIYRANWIRITHWLNRRIPGAREATRVLRNREATVVAMLVGTNLCGVFATEFASRFCAETLGPAWTGLAVAVVVLLTLVLGDYLPKALAQSAPDRWLRVTGVFVNGSRIAFAPAVYGLVGLARLFAAPASGRPRDFVLTRQDFLAALSHRDDQTASAGAIRNLAARLFRFSAMKVSEVAIPVGRVKSVPAGTAGSGIGTVVREHGFSRVPVYDGDPTNITGVVAAKDVLGAPDFRIRRVGRVPGATRAIEVLRDLQRRGEHLTVVTDEGGRVTGMVTLEDLLEELVGEIRSEA
jgi:CBS domain containing-hemolysin-like protein